MVRIAGIGEMVLSGDTDDVLKTFALSSCVAVIAYDMKYKTAGLIHIALPSSMNTEDSGRRPHYYAETGLPLLLRGLCQNNRCVKTNLRFSVIGGAEPARTKDYFAIGKKNLQKVLEMLSELELNYQATEIGGTVSRTVEFHVATGILKVYSQAMSL